MAVLFMFFGHPGAGKTTLARRFGELCELPDIDTDHFMTVEERQAVRDGVYTRAMRLANIERYCAAVRRDYAGRHVALADGLPNNEARRFLLDQFAAGDVILVLVQTGAELWERRLSARADNPVAVTVAEARAYINASWEPVDPAIPHTVIDNGINAGTTEAALRALYQHAAGQS